MSFQALDLVSFCYDSAGPEVLLKVQIVNVGNEWEVVHICEILMNRFEVTNFMALNRIGLLLWTPAPLDRKQVEKGKPLKFNPTHLSQR